MKTLLPFLVVLSGLTVASSVMAHKAEDFAGAVTLNAAGARAVNQQNKDNTVVNQGKKKRSKNSGKKRQPVLTKRDNSDGTITYKTAGKPDADLSETISLKQSKEIDQQAKEAGVKVIEIREQPVITKKINSDGTVTYNSVSDSKADSPETVSHKKSKNIEQQAKDSGVKVVEIEEQSVMSKKINSDGTVTYNPVGEPRPDTSETISKREGKAVDEKFEKQGVKVIDISPSKDTTPHK